MKTQALPLSAGGQAALYISFKFTSDFGNDCYLDLAKVYLDYSSICVGNPAPFQTETGMTAYSWILSSGGTITGGSGTASITATWPTPGPKTVSVNYTNANGCKANSPTVATTTINPLPVPTISGPTFVCVHDTVLYRTQKNMTSYLWNISTGGTINGSASDSVISVTWDTASSVGNRWVTVAYANSLGCFGTTPVPYNVTVNPLPVPTITGPDSLCRNSIGTYQTEPTMTGYSWTVSPGGVILTGLGTRTITVRWDSVGAQTVSVSYTTVSGCETLVPSMLPVTVHPLPVPSITGPDSVCEGTGGHFYSTEPMNTAYQWTLSGGGTIVSGTGTSLIMVTWDSAGARQVLVNYTSSLGCNALLPTSYPVTVKPQPVPSVTGPTPVCKGVPGNQYTTQSGMLNYTWNVSSGNTITSGGTTASNFIEVTWNVLDTQRVFVNYTAANGCTAQTATSYPVKVNALPLPTIGGPDTVCANTSGNIYGTQPGMSNYTWGISAGGTITSGAGTDTITVTWDLAGTRSVSVNYTDSNGCAAAAPTSYNVLIEPLPVPVITGPTSACVGSTGNTYTTQSGMTNYQWVISNGGTITAGGSDSVNTVTVTWDYVGAQTVSVGYTNAIGCTSASLSGYNVTVHPLPVPTITGDTIACENAGNYTYTTETGMTGYVWSTSPSGLIVSGQGTSQVQVTWQGTGAQWVAVSYINATGCSAFPPTQLDVNVTPLPGTPGNITGTSMVCAGDIGVSYSVAPVPYATSYIWLLPPGATIATGAGTTSITVDFSVNALSGVILVYGSNICGNGPSSPSFPVLVNKIPAKAGFITGLDTVCRGATGVNYFISPIPGADNYIWTVPSGASIISGGNTPSIMVSFSDTASSGIISVFATNYCGAGIPSPNFVVTTVSPLAAPVITQMWDFLYSDQSIGNQWYFEGSPIPGATGQIYQAMEDGEYWDEVHRFGCTSDTSNHIDIVVTGIDETKGSRFSVHPVPNDGRFTVSMRFPGEDIFVIRVYNNLGLQVYELADIEVKFRSEQYINMNTVPNGVYTVVMENDRLRIVRKIIVIN
ncbi:MAG: T9SS type A sorting domain-containing protein [Bacteroidota bacterium]